ncbi:MAG: ABC transporter permease [Ilumatobacteraceae bacterium]
MKTLIRMFGRWVRDFPSLSTVLSLITGVVVWEVLARIISQPYLPRFSGVASRLGSLVADGQILSDLGRSLQNLLFGFLISSIVGVLLGIACGRYWIVERTLRPYVNALITCPTVVFVPIYFAIFGTSRWAIIFLIVHYSVFYVLVNTTTAVQSVSRELLEMAKVFGASERQRVRKVVLPSALPLIFASLRVSVGRSVKGMINGEVLIAVIGLGATSQNFSRQFDMEGVFAIAIVVVLVSLVLTNLLSLVDNRINRWVPNTRK